MVVMMDLDQEPIPLNSKLWSLFSVFINNIFFAMHYRCWCDQWSSWGGRRWRGNHLYSVSLMIVM